MVFTMIITVILAFVKLATQNFHKSSISQNQSLSSQISTHNALVERLSATPTSYTRLPYANYARRLKNARNTAIIVRKYTALTAN